MNVFSPDGFEQAKCFFGERGAPNQMMSNDASIVRWYRALGSQSEATNTIVEVENKCNYNTGSA